MRPEDMAAFNREAVRKALLECPGITLLEIEGKTGLSKGSVSRHVKSIRAEWGGVKTRKRREAAE